MVFHEHGSVSKLALEEFPDPVAGPGDAVLRVKATSLNGFDPMILAGTTGLRTPLPMIPCGDIAGEIVLLGAEVAGDEWKIGDRVCPHPFVLGEGMTGETRLGAACEYVRIPARNLIRRGKVQEGEKVLILGATGGVGTCCLQIAKAAGAEVVVTGSAAWKLEKLRELGADHTIDTSQQDFVEVVHDLFGKPRMFGGGGVQVIINYIGGETWARALRCLASHGRMLTCGATAGFEPPTDIRYIWSFEQQVIGSNGWMPDEQVALLQTVAEGRIQPVLHAVRSLEEIPQSIQELIDRRVVGKTVITPS
jgi:alcohol dehydrogenase